MNIKPDPRTANLRAQISSKSKHIERLENLLAPHLADQLDAEQRADFLDASEEDFGGFPDWAHQMLLVDADYCSEIGDCSTLSSLGEKVAHLCRMKA